MRKINICFLILLLLTGCYGVEEQELTPLAELTIGNPTDVINAGSNWFLMLRYPVQMTKR